MRKLLIVDDNEDLRTQLKWGLSKEYAVFAGRDAAEAMTLFAKHQPWVVVLDLGLPPHEHGTQEGLRCLNEILVQAPLTKVIVITGNEQKESALAAIGSGAYDYYQKPVDLDELRIIIRRAANLAMIEGENLELRRTLEHKATSLGGMLGHCPEMQTVFSLVRKVASSDAAVLIEGESGTGKELVARAVHAHSLRKDGPFIPINCGAIPENLLESELFGYEKGAYTGANAQVLGKVEFAHKGTFFLDEVGALPAQLQVKLLRFLQDKVIQRIGGREDIVVDTRIVAASNRDLMQLIDDNRFREDLFYRLGVVVIKLPPLRERKGDIVLLANYFLKKYSSLYGKRVRGFSTGALNRMEAYEWPGNVRELENKVQRSIILSEGGRIESHDLGFHEEGRVNRHQSVPVGSLKEAKDRLERNMLTSALDKHRGNIAKAAEDLGISRPTIYDIMKKHGLHTMGQAGVDQLQARRG